LDPFLLLDHFRVKPPAGFPDHPHRGFQTVTYMLKGKFRHRDNRGHEGIIAAGDMQWMTAGAGIVHSEMPATEGENEGLQIWINLAAKNKFVPASYQEKRSTEIPVFETADGKVRVKVLAGAHGDVSSEVLTLTPTEMLDVTLGSNTLFERTLPATWNACVYVMEGALFLGSKQISAGELGVLESNAGDGIRLQSGDSGSRFLFLSGEPLHEPVAHYGPIVMNTRKEVMEAISDYQQGKF
jgi:redox-sensitive bicupin YhaK (pirin superfamily)